MEKQAPARIRIRRETLAAWSRVYTHIRQALADADGDHRTYGGEPSDGEVFHHMVAITHQALGLGETAPFVAGGPYEAPPPELDRPPQVMDAIIDSLRAARGNAADCEALLLKHFPDLEAKAKAEGD